MQNTLELEEYSTASKQWRRRVFESGGITEEGSSKAEGPQPKARKRGGVLGEGRQPPPDQLGSMGRAL